MTSAYRFWPHVTEALDDVPDSLYRDLLYNLGIVLFRTDEDGRWTFLSSGWPQISGYSIHDSIGVPARLYVHDSDLRKSSRLLGNMQRSPGAHFCESLRVRRADGRLCPIEVQARLDVNAQGVPIAMSGVLIDLSRRRPLRDRPQLFPAMPPRPAAVGATPAQPASWTAVLDALQSLAATPLSPAQRQYVRSARSGVDALRALAPAASADAHREGSAALHILLAEDQPITQKLVTLLLEKRGHHVCVANDGQAALDCFVRAEFDLVLMDLQMPVMDGLTATRAIREYETLKRRRRTPIVAMTAQTGAGDRELCLNAGMDDYLAKPVVTQALEQVLQDHCRRPALT